MADETAKKAGMMVGRPEKIAEKLKEYCRTEPVPPNAWIEATYETVAQDKA